MRYQVSIKIYEIEKYITGRIDDKRQYIYG